jgi:hypothetical protein
VVPRTWNNVAGRTKGLWCHLMTRVARQLQVALALCKATPVSR